MRFNYKSNYDGLQQRFNSWRKLPQQMRQIVEQAADEARDLMLDHLETQGRGGQPPPLSPITQKIYQQDGQPDGSGIRDHIEVRTQHNEQRAQATVGIPQGQPTLVARVQNRGATIRVTDKMRGWFAARGVYLKPTTKVIRVRGRKFWDKSIKSAKQSYKRKLKSKLKN